MRKLIIISVFVMTCGVFAATASASAGQPGIRAGGAEAFHTHALASAQAGDQSARGAVHVAHRADEQRVLAVLKQRVGDIRLLEKVGHKLSAMSEKRLRLAVSLSDHLTGGAPAAETDIAFLLLTTLIVFS